jgi:hypothetical protein
MIHIDLSAAEQFLSTLDSRLPLNPVLAHPAYRLVFEHARRFGNGLTQADVENSLRGSDSPFYGLRGLTTNRAGIEGLLEQIRAQQSEWTVQIHAALETLCPLIGPEIPIYPILGYDMGIGLAGGVAMNCNTKPYLDDPREFLYYAIHECTHVLYERSHAIPPLEEVDTPAGWRTYFHLWLHNEGFATYAPLKLRRASAGLQERDYLVLSDPRQIENTLAACRDILARLAREEPLSREETLAWCFGDRRITYRAGCELIRRIEVRDGLEAVRQAFQMSAGEFVSRWSDLLRPSAEEAA